MVDYKYAEMGILSLGRNGLSVNTGGTPILGTEGEKFFLKRTDYARTKVCFNPSLSSSLIGSSTYGHLFH